MKRQYHFEQKKFCQLPIKQQHKKCLELLEHILQGNFDLLAHYNELANLFSYPAIILKTAVGDAPAAQDFEPESLAIGGEHCQTVKAPSITNDSGTKDCVDGASSTAVFRIIDKKALLDRLQEHYQLSGMHRKEHDFFVTTQDKAQGLEYLPITIYLDHLRSSHNIGSILRTTEALRLGTCVFSEKMVAFDNPQLKKKRYGDKRVGYLPI